MVGWVITWEWKGEQGGPKSKIAAVLRYRPSKVVREIVEVLYATSQYSPAEFYKYCVVQKGKNNPHPARFAEVNGVPWEAQIYCGDNPYLFARLVDGLRMGKAGKGEPTVKWKELPLLPEYVEKNFSDGREATEGEG